MDKKEILSQMNQHLNNHSYDWVTRLMLADLLDEMGQEKEVRFQRWLVAHKKAPEWNFADMGNWDWFSNGDNDDRIRPSWLGVDIVFKDLEKLMESEAWAYETRVQAEQALRRTLESLDYKVSVPTTTSEEAT